MKSLHIVCIMTAEMHDYAHKRVLCENQRRVMIEIFAVLHPHSENCFPKEILQKNFLSIRSI